MYVIQTQAYPLLEAVFELVFPTKSVWGNLGSEFVMIFLCIFSLVLWRRDRIPGLNLPLDQVGNVRHDDAGRHEAGQPHVGDGLGHDAADLLLQVGAPLMSSDKHE